MASTNFVAKNGLTVASGTVVAGGSSGSNGQVLSSTGTGVQWVNASSGDVVGPASSTDNAIVRFDSTTGKLIQNSTATLSDGGIMIVTELDTDSIKSATANSPITIAPDGTGDVHLNTDSVRIGDNNADATLHTRGTGDLIITTHEGSANEGIVRLYDGANGNITLTPNGSGQVKVGTDQVVTLVASQTLTNKTISGSSNTLSNIANASLTNSTISGVALGSNLNALTISSPLSGGSYNGSSAVSIGIPVATTSVNGYLSSADWTTFNNKGSGSVTSVAATVPSLLSISGSPITTSGTLAITYSGTALPVANGGTGLTTLTAGYIPYGAGTSAFGSSADLFWDSTNSRLGIGTASPSAKLQVNSSGNTPLNLVGSLACQINLNDGTQNANWGLGVGGVGITGIASPSTYPLVLYTNATERMRIDSSGNVGIGTTTASAKLNIATTDTRIEFGQASSSIAYIEVLNAARTAALSLSSYALGFDWLTNTGSGWTSRLSITNSGNVGIGTASPSEKLSVKSATGINSVTDIASLTNPSQTSAGVRMLFNNGYGNLGAISSFQLDNGAGADNGVLAFQTASDAVLSTKMTILDTGNVGIGTASPTFKLDVQGSSAGYLEAVRFKNTNAAGYLTTSWTVGSAEATIRYAPSILFKIGPDSGDTTTPIVFATNNGTERMRIDSSGNVGIGTASPNYKLDVNGAIVNGINGAYGAYTRISGGTLKPYFATSGNDTFYYNTNASGSIKWVNATDTATLMTLDNSGNLTNIGVFKGNSGSKGFGGITTTTSTSTPTGGSSGDHYYIY